MEQIYAILQKDALGNVRPVPAYFSLIETTLWLACKCEYNFEEDKFELGFQAKFYKFHVCGLEEFMVDPTLGQKYDLGIANNYRTRFLFLFYKEYMRIFHCQEMAKETTLKEEENIYSKTNSKVGYVYKAVHLIKRLQSSNIDIMRLRLSDNETPESQKLEHLVTGRDLYDKLKVYVLSEEELQKNHFPRPDSVGRAKFIVDVAKGPHLPSDERFCTRCKRSFKVMSSGKPVVEDECMYHWGKLKYGCRTSHTCCDKPVGTSGCEVASAHVHHNNKFDGSSGYVMTSQRAASPEGPGVFAMDCEMVYTTAGMEIARITIADAECKIVYDTFVRPTNEIVDFNTRFSGITEDDMKEVLTTLNDVQIVLLHYFSADTILIGHSLECDLRALKLVHSTVIDTSVLYLENINGRPRKRGLKQLTHSYLCTTIQDGVNGHDSQEDAIAAMRLVHYRLREDSNGTPRQ